jgi:uncharacterized phage protein gp47/JayE
MAISDLIYIDATGFHYPDYQTILTNVQNSYRQIYGDDIYITPDSLDGQFLAVLAQIIYDTAQTGEAAYLSISPATASGTALSNNVKLNGLVRLLPSYSTVDLEIKGAVGAELLNCSAQDAAGINWLLPASVIIGITGIETVTATAENVGAIAADAGTINIIGTPTRGWFTVTNPAAASVGNPTETDAELRIRQTNSVALPSRSVLQGIYAGILALTNVTKVRVYENPTSSTDVDGLPPHSISAVVAGGDSALIAQQIAIKKTTGCDTYGTTSETVTLPNTVPAVINFYRPTEIVCGVKVELVALAGYSTTITQQLIAAIAQYISGFNFGEDVIWARMFAAANLPPPSGLTFYITAVTIKKGAGSYGTSNLAYAFNELATSTAVSTVVVVS